MVYFKSLSTNLISIYVSLFLIFSPLHGQANDNLKEDAFSDEKKKYKLKLISGTKFMFDHLEKQSKDFLLISSNEIEKNISIDLIEVITIKKESHAIRNGALIGFVFGAVVGGLLAQVLDELGQGSDPEGSRDLGALIGGVGSAVVGTIIGRIVRGSKKEKIYDMTGWSVAQKKEKIQELINSE